MYPMTAEVALKVGKAAGIVFKNGKRTKIIIGKDTRLSGYVIESALMAGLLSVGVEVYLVGPYPTPAIAHIVKSFAADGGIVISASHNPYEDNGIKFFDAEGCINIKYQKNRIYPRIFLTNSDIELINYVKDYFKRTGIKSNIQINTKKGKEKIILNKNTKTTKDCYNLSIENFQGVKKFADEINFTVNRKKSKLNKVIRSIEKHGNKIIQNKNLLFF